MLAHSCTEKNGLFDGNVSDIRVLHHNEGILKILRATLLPELSCRQHAPIQTMSGFAISSAPNQSRKKMLQQALFAEHFDAKK
jgi:hypothetical protein